MLSKINTKIKKREYPKDVFITPIPLAKICISKHNINKKDIWYDPFKNNGSFYNNFPNEIKNKKWSEILENKDFFKFNEKVDIISSNPPYSMLDKVFIKTLEICNKEFGYLIGWNNLTARRIEMCNKKGFYIKSMEMFKVYKWFGMSCYVVFSNEIKDNIISYNRKVWR